MSVVSRVPEAGSASARGVASVDPGRCRPTSRTAIEWRRRHARALLAGRPRRPGARAWHRSGGALRLVRCAAGGRPGRVLRRCSELVLAVVWWASLQIHQSRSPLVVGHGSEEYRRVIVATFRVFAVLAMLSLALQIDASRIYLATAFPLGLVGLLVERKLARVGLHRARTPAGRRRRRSSSSAASGPPPSSPRWFAKHPTAGYEVGGVWVPDESHAARCILDGFAATHPGDVGQPRLRRGARACPAPRRWW